MLISTIIAILYFLPAILFSQNPPGKADDDSGGYVWLSDNGNGTYNNPIIYADYSDPDVIRVGDNFYMVSSSFHCTPVMPVLHSNDLVNWTIIGHVSENLPSTVFDQPQHGKGCWAPSMRFHNGEFYVYYGDPDFGIYMSKTKNPAGPWEPLLLIKEAKGWIDPCPLWDVPGLLLQKLPAPQFSASTRLTINPININEKAGLIVMGYDYAYVALVKMADGIHLRKTVCLNSEKGSAEIIETDILINNSTIFLKVDVKNDAKCDFNFSEDGTVFKSIGKEFIAREGRWIGAKVGIFALAPYESSKSGHADFEWFRIKK
ncbi:MAG: family 43 glycosylhydrolase [Bacteroidota bacterium]